MKKYGLKSDRFRTLLSLVLILALFICAVLPPMEAGAAQAGETKENSFAEENSLPEENSFAEENSFPEENSLQEEGGSSEDNAPEASEPEEAEADPDPAEEMAEEEKEPLTEKSKEMPGDGPQEPREESSKESSEESSEEISAEQEEEEVFIQAPLLGASAKGSIPAPLGNVTVGRQGRTELPAASQYVNYTRCWYVIRNNVRYWAVCARASASGAVPPNSPDSRTASCRYNYLNEEAVNGIAAWQKSGENGTMVPIKKDQGFNAGLAKAVLVSMFTRADIWEESFSSFSLSYGAAHLLVSDLLFGDDDACYGENYDLVFHQMRSKVEKWMEDPANAALVDACTAYIAYLWEGGSATGRQAVVWVEGLPGVMDLKKSAEDQEGNPVQGQDLTGTTYALYKDPECQETAKDIFGKEAVFVCGSNGEAGQILLPFGTYYLKETRAAAGMNLDEEVYTVELVRSTSFGDALNYRMNEVADTVREKTLGEGSLVMEKRDTESGSARGGASLEGAVYDLIVDQEEGVTDENGYYGKGQVYVSLTTDAAGKASLDHIPEGSYLLKERTASRGYKVSGEERRVLIEEGKTLSLTEDKALPEEILRASFAFSKTGSDDVRMAGVLFRVTCAETGDSWEIVTGEDGTYDSLKETDPRRQRPVYGSYLLEELPCPANEGFTLSGPVTFRVDSEKALDLGTLVNYRAPSAATVLTGLKGEKYLRTEDKVTLTDTVSLHDMYDYKGKEIRLKGILVDPETGEEVCSSEKTRNLASAEETLTMDFVLNASDLGGKSLVAFEYVYGPGGQLIAKHEDLKDPGQTVHFPALRTEALCQGTGDHVLPSSGRAVVRDTIRYRALEGGKTYRAEGILYDAETGEPFRPGGKDVKSSVTFTADPSGEGSVTAEFSFELPGDTGARILVAAETLYDSQGETAAVHKDLKDQKQTLYVPGILTKARDLLTGDHAGTASTRTTFRDKVVYAGLCPGEEYEVSGTLMVRGTGEPLKAGGKTVAASKIFTPEAESGFVFLDFTFDASALAGETLVAFEELSHKGISVAVHADLGDREQSLVYPGIRTRACDVGTEDHLGILPAGSGRITVRDKVELTGLVPDCAYLVRGTLWDKKTGQALKGKDGKEIRAEKEFTASSERESLELTFTAEASVSGKTLVVCEDLIHNGAVVASHKDLEDKEQSVFYPGILTSAEDAATESHTGAAAEKAVIRDRVFYSSLIPSTEEAPVTYTVKGTLMLKSSGEPLLDREGKEITSQVAFSPETSSGSVVLTFEFDASLLQGETVVCFERLYREDLLAAVHADLEDRDQSVFYPAVATRAYDDRTGTHTGAAGEVQSLTDLVTCTNLLPGTYVVKGVLTDSETGLPFTDADGQEVRAEKTFTASESVCQIPVTFTFRAGGLSGRTLTVFESLYTKEGILLASHQDREDNDQMILYPEISTEAEDARTLTHTGPVKETVTITDHVYYSNLIPSTREDPREYTIRGVLMVKSTGMPLLDEKGEEVTSEHVFRPRESSGCEDLSFTFSSALLGGETLVCFETLYEKDLEVASHADLEDHAQSVYYPSVRTRASVSGKKEAAARGRVTVEDLVEYRNLVPGTEYELTGVLMDKKTGKPLTAKGKEVRSSVSFVPKEADGSIRVAFTFDASGLGEKTLVVFETLFVNGIQAASHADLKDLDQTVDLTPPSNPPRTGDGAGAFFWTLPLLSGLAGICVLIGTGRRKKR